MLDTAFYLATKDITQRAGLVGKRYVVADGRYVLDNKDLSRITFTTDEYINGLDGVEKITQEEAQGLIAENGYTFVEKIIGNNEDAESVEQETEEE